MLPQGLNGATHALRVRGRLVVVAIHPEPVAVDLMRVFWRELTLVGARVYERQDFEEAVAMVADGRIRADAFISAIEPLDRTAEAFATLEAGGDVMKVLIDCRDRGPMSSVSAAPAFDLTGQLAVVTGARRGIGLAIAQALARAGADIIGVSARLEPDGSEAPAQCRPSVARSRRCRRLVRPLERAGSGCAAGGARPSRRHPHQQRRDDRPRAGGRAFRCRLGPRARGQPVCPVPARPRGRCARWSSAAAARSSSPPRC